MRPTSKARSILYFALLVPVLITVRGDESSSVASLPAALRKFQAFVGDWRGVGQPRRGSAKGAWSEEFQWAWDFRSDKPALSWTSTNGKFLRDARLVADETGKLTLIAKSSAGEDRRFIAAADESDSLVLTSEKPGASDEPDRLTIRVVAGGDRFLVLYERRADGDRDRFTRLAEVGATRKGSDFGQGGSYVECVVTGGAGTIPVSHEGQMYYVCCTGCRDYFNDNAAEVLAEYRARKGAEKGKKK